MTQLSIHSFSKNQLIDKLQQLQTKLKTEKAETWLWKKRTTEAADAIEQFEQLQTEIKRLQPFEVAVKKRHNGYDPDNELCEEPDSPEQALQDLQDEWNDTEADYADQEDELQEEIKHLRTKNDRMRIFVNTVANMTQRAVTDNTTDEAEDNGVASMLRGFIAEARWIEQSLKEAEIKAENKQLQIKNDKLKKGLIKIRKSDEIMEAQRFAKETLEG